MCGIISYVGSGGATDRLLVGLDRLEYRGYDSAGIAVQNGGGLEIRKCKGEVKELKARVGKNRPDGSVGIGHTRWSTHGPPTDQNAHPHTDCTGSIAVVHNGIIENYDSLLDRLKMDHVFESETDTEVVPHLIEAYVHRGYDREQAFRRSIDRLEGSFAIVASISHADELFAARRGSPLVLGIGTDGYYLASDVPAILEFTDEVIYLEDGDMVVVNPEGYRIIDEAGQMANRTVHPIEWDREDAEKGGFDHYMLKEIHEQPAAIERALAGRISNDATDVLLKDFGPGSFKEIEHVHLVACGTSYHAALYTSCLLNGAGIRAQAFRAGEYTTEPVPTDRQTLVIGVTQSGETADTLSSLRSASRAGARTLAVTNVVGSTAARETEDRLLIRAGPEIGVAATKTFSSQVVTLLLLIQRIAKDVTGEPMHEAPDVNRDLKRLPDEVTTVIESDAAGLLARRYSDASAFFFIGRGLGRSVAYEGALKFKEITYKHAEGFAAGELKHGPLALVTEDTPVIAIFTGEHDDKTINNVQEVRARNAPVIALGPRSTFDTYDLDGDVLAIPDMHPKVTGILENVHLQLLAYHAANELGRPIDKPRNLAKSVTVE